MKRVILLFLVVCGYFTSQAQGVIERNRQAPRASFVTYRNASLAMRAVVDSSENISRLNGEWSFQYLEPGVDVPRSILESGSDISSLAKINLPASWQMSGVGEAVFSRKAYDFLRSKPEGRIPEVGLSPSVAFVSDVSVPFDYLDRALYLHVGAARADLTVYVNGEQVGQSTDSKNPAEFNISKYVVRGLNRVVLKVSQWSQGSLLEDQSAWRLSGLNRDIYLFAQPKIRIADYLVRTTLDPSYTNGLLETALILKTELLNPHSVSVYYDLYDGSGKLVNQASREVELSMRGVDTIRFTASIPNVEQWNAETPNLYTILYRVKREGRWTEFVAVKTGFRTVEIRDGKMLLNGLPLRIKGVNLAEHNIATGDVVTSSDYRRTIIEMKQAGFNAVRTDGYPLGAAFYDLCDELGMYVCDVANINAQGLGTERRVGRTLANDPVWKDAFLYRVNNMYERNKAHTSVIMWALGDDAGNGFNMYEAYMALKAKEHTRPVVYNGAGIEFNTDVYCPSYPESKDFERSLALLQGQPVILSRTDFRPRYWSSDTIQGGFLSRWASPDITASGVKFADLSDDYVRTQRTDGKVAMPSVQGDIAAISRAFANVVVDVVDRKRGVIEVQNNLQYANLSQLDVRYRIVKAGKVLKEYRLDIAAAPGERVRVTLPGDFLTLFMPKDELEIQFGDLYCKRF